MLVDLSCHIIVEPTHTHPRKNNMSGKRDILIIRLVFQTLVTSCFYFFIFFFNPGPVEEIELALADALVLLADARFSVQELSECKETYHGVLFDRF